jgi:serine protease Do
MRSVLLLFALSLATAGCGLGDEGEKRREGATTAPTAPASLADLVEKTRSGIIRIETTSCDGKGVGSGFLVGPRLVATVEHVVGGASEIVLKRGDDAVANAVVVGSDRARDLALLRADQPV